MSLFSLLKLRYAALLLPLCVPALPAAAAAAAPDTTEAQVARAAQQFLSAQARREGLLEPDFNINVVTRSRAPAACSRPLDVTPADAQRRSRMKFTAVCADGWRENVVVRIDASAEVLVAAASLPAGRVLSDDDIALERRDIANLPDALSDADALKGQATRRPLRAGQVLTRQMLAAPQLVRRGEPVRILVRSGAIEVAAAGEALEAGQRDDVVRVRNSSTGKIIRARVIEHSVVEPVAIPHSPD